MDVTFYKTTTGEIVRYGSVREPELNCGEDEAFIEGIYRDTLYRVEKGRAVALVVSEVEILSWDVNAERDRRLARGFDFDFGEGQGIHHIGTTIEDMKGWDEVSTFAQALINAGQGAGTIDLMTDTGPARVTAEEWQHVLIAAAEFRQPIWAASFVLNAMSPIPMDYADARWWP